MTNHANCGDCDLGADAAQTRTGERQNLRKAMKRAAEAQRRLNEAIYLANARGVGNNTSSSSSESESEGAGRTGRRSEGVGGRAHFHPFHHGPWTGRHGMPGAHGPWASMRGFPPGRHMMGFPGFGAGFPGMGPHGVGPHPHHHGHGHGHAHGHPHGPGHHHGRGHHHGHGHHHHHRVAFGDFHPFGGHGGPCGRHGGMGGHGHGPWSGPLGRQFPHFGDVGHRSGRRERAQSVPRF